MTGKASRGELRSCSVASQYGGAMGKSANCRVDVSVRSGARPSFPPLTSSFYLVEARVRGPLRGAAATIPDPITYQIKGGLEGAGLDRSPGIGGVALDVLTATPTERILPRPARAGAQSGAGHSRRICVRTRTSRRALRIARGRERRAADILADRPAANPQLSYDSQPLRCAAFRWP